MRFGTSALAALALITVAPAQAKTIAYQYVGPGCTYGCSNIGVANGTQINLTVYLDSRDIQPNADIYQPGLSSPGYTLKIGSYHHTGTDATFWAQLSSNTNSFVPRGPAVPGPIPGTTADVFFASGYKNLPGVTFGAADIGWGIQESHCDDTECSSSWLAYGYDPSGNATFIRDGSQPSIADIFRGAVQVSTGSAWLPFREEKNLDDRYPQDLKDLVGDAFLTTGIGAEFTPGGGISLADAAHRLGYDHFNWLQLVSDPANPGVGFAFDPPPSCYEALTYVGSPCPNRDTLPWYLDEQYTIDGKPVYDSSGVRVTADDTAETRLEEWTDSPDTLLFNDAPNVPMDYVTCLAGVRPDGTGDILNITKGGVSDTCFTWNSEGPHPIVTGEFEDLGGGTRLNLFYSGFLQDSYFDEGVDTELSDLGIGLRTIDVSAPEPLTLALFASGLFGLGFQRRRTS